jgi:hypothetical protein
MRRSKKLSLVIAPLLVLGLAGTAFALTTFAPTLSLDASANRFGHRIVAAGTYDAVSPICHGPGGRSVTVYVNGKAKALGSTRGKGQYRIGGIGPFPAGTYQVQTFVPGSVRSGYGQTHVCLDAWSNVDPVRLGKPSNT